MLKHGKHILCIFLLLFLFNASSAQTKLPPTNFLFRTVNWAYKIIEGDSAKPKKKYFFVIPIISYKPETRWQAGVNFSYFFKAKQNDSITRTSFIRTNLSLTQNKQYSIRPYYDVFTAKNKYNFRGAYQFSDFIEYYWGIGNTVPDAGKELYAFRQHKAIVKALRLVHKGLYVGLQANMESTYNINYDATGTMKNSTDAGTQGYNAIGVGPVVSFDTRDHVYFPTKGHFIDIYATAYNTKVGSNYNFNTLNIDARKYVSLGGENVLAFQGFGHFNKGNVPYRMMGTLGNESYFRGYYFGRYRDLQAASLQAELRKTLWGPASMVAFVGAGNVALTLDKLSHRVKPMFGLGLRVKAIPREKINIRIDYAWGEKGIQAFYVSLNEAF